MKTPPLLIGAALLFWGWQAEALLPAAVIAALLEGAHRLQWRWNLSAADFSRTADLCTGLFVLVTAYVVFSVGLPHAVVAAVKWLPAVLLPLMAAQAYSMAQAVPLSALFFTMRRQEPTGLADFKVDLGYPYFVVCILAAGAANTRSEWFYPCVVALAGWALWPRRRAGTLGLWCVLFGLAGAVGYASHAGLHQLQLAFEGAVVDWLSLSGQRTDPYRSSTDIGTIGELKLFDHIVLRLESPQPLDRPLLLHRASYDQYASPTWLARDAQLVALRPEAGGHGWRLRSDAPLLRRVTIWTDFPRGTGVLALPSGTVRIEGLAGAEVKHNRLGVVQAEQRAGRASYDAVFGTAEGGDPPREADMRVPRAEAATLERIVAQLGPRGRPPREIVAIVERYFREKFQYSTYQKTRGGEGTPIGRTPIGHFLLASRAGHCEYFATATVLLLRAAGVPARYATGFSVQELSRLEGVYVVRERHAHSWVRVYFDGAWHDLDTTPPTWFAVEQQSAPFWGPAADLWSWLSYRMARAGGAEGGAGGYAAWIMLLLVLYLAWRLYRKQRVSVANEARGAAAVTRAGAGRDSEFYLVEKRLAELGYARDTGEPVRSWLGRIGRTFPHPELLPVLGKLVALHYRYRFDPVGLDADERQRLSAGIMEWLDQFKAAS